MGLLCPSCGMNRGSAVLPLLVPLVPLLVLLSTALCAHGCPQSCLCSSQTVKCQNQLLDAIPPSLPANTKFLFLTDNSISNIGADSFPTRLDQLTDLYLSGNELESVDAMAFENLPNLQRLDLSSNQLQNFSDRAFPADSKLQLLNLSNSFSNHSSMKRVLSFLCSGNLLQLTSLDLSNNPFVILPDGVFTNLSSLARLNLQNNSIITIPNGTLTVPPLLELDLRDNSLKFLSPSTQAELSLKPTLRVWLARNPWRCDCFIEETLVWLRNSTQVVDMNNLTCAEPKALRQQQLLVLESTRLKCSSELEGVLETSYVFLGLVLALIGVIFLLVLYLNRKGIKRWMYNIRDACRDHMEGYHYRYEINSDPRLANLSINSDV